MIELGLKLATFFYREFCKKKDSKTMVSITEANQNFSKVARLVDEKGSAVILKNNAPKYVLINYEDVEAIKDADDELVMAISEMLMDKNEEAYKKLAQ